MTISSNVIFNLKKAYTNKLPVEKFYERVDEGDFFVTHTTFSCIFNVGDYGN